MMSLEGGGGEGGRTKTKTKNVISRAKPIVFLGNSPKSKLQKSVALITKGKMQSVAIILIT